MSIGQGSITRTTNSGAPPGFINVAGARNGLTVDADGYIVLGQDDGASGDPGKFLTNRAEQMNGFAIDWYNGNFIVSDSGTGPVSTAAFQVVLVNDAAQPVALFRDESGGVISEGVVIDATPAAGNITGPILFQAQRTGLPILTIEAGGVVSFLDTRDGVGSVGNAFFSPTIYVGRQLENGKTICLNITSEWRPLSTPGFGLGLSDIAVDSNVLFDTADNYDYAAFRISSNVQQSGGSTTVIRGILYSPNIVAVTAPIVAFENLYGHVLLCTDTSSPNVGSVSIRLGSTATLPTAYLHIGAGAAGAGNAPFKLTAGPLLTVPEDGAIEYDGTNFYKTIGSTRTVIL